MTLKFAGIADIPDMVAASRAVPIGTVKLSAGDPFYQFDRFEDRAVAMPATASVVHFARPRRRVIVPEHVHQIIRMKVVSHLLSFVSQNGIGRAEESALHKV